MFTLLDKKYSSFMKNKSNLSFKKLPLDSIPTKKEKCTHRIILLKIHLNIIIFYYN